MQTALADAILLLHLGIIAFNIAGLIIIPLGAARHWRVVRIAWLRLFHLALLGIVAAQALAGRACILTIWQNQLTGGAIAPNPLIVRTINRLIYWPLPFWFFTIIYCAVFVYVAALYVLVPFGKPQLLASVPNSRR